MAYILRPPILGEIPRDRHVVIEASAGTGKTYTIEHMVIDLLIGSSALMSEILVLTFTERAAAELRQRIRSKIESMLHHESAEETTAAGTLPPGIWLIDQAARQKLSRALYSFDGASIGTIHGFFGRILAERAFANQRLFDGELVDGRLLFSRAFKTALRRTLAVTPGDTSDLLAVWLARNRGGVEKLEDLLWTCHASHRRILPPFSMATMRREVEASPLFAVDLAATAEKLKVALKATKVDGKAIHGGTINAIVSRMNKLATLIEGARRDWTIALHDDFQEDVHWVAGTLKKLGERAGPVAAQLADAFVRIDESVVCLEAAIVQTSLPIVQDVLKSQKAATGEFDHDDQIRGVIEALDGPYGDELVRAMRARYRFALIDEFQDTDELQWKFFERVFIDSGAGNLACLIGDPKQAIYGFRGADVQTYLRACERVQRSGLRPIPLRENFRSTAALIEAYNLILDASAKPPFFEGEIGYPNPVAAGRELVALEADGSAAVPIHVLEIEPRAGDSISAGELRRGLARQIAREASRLLSDQGSLSFGPAGETERIKPGDIYVLTATNKEAVQVSEALREARLPFAFYKQEGLFQTDQAHAIHDLLAAVADPGDPDKRGRAWITPFFAVPLAALPDLDELADSDPLIKWLRDWNELARDRRFEMLFTRILDDSGIIRRELFLKEDERALTNYLHIFEILLEETRTVGRDLADLVAVLTSYIQQTSKPSGEDGNIQRLESDREAIQIMTIHKSKGLEAAVVFLFGGYGRFRGGDIHEYHEDNERVLYIGNNDLAKARANEERMQEEQRLYYVALTRAKARLYLPLVPEQLSNKKWDGG